MSDHQHAACKALATADVGAVEILGASPDSMAPSFNTARHKEKVMTMSTKSEKPLLALIEAGGVNDMPVILPAAAPNNALIEALATVKAAGYRVSKPRKSKTFKRGKDRVGPTFVAEFADGEVTRMTTCCSPENLDWKRGERLSQAAYQSRRQTHDAPPAIISAWFEQDGEVLARRPDNGGVS